MQFRHLIVGDKFDWIGPQPTFFLRCEKISTRKYCDEKGTEHRVGSINAEVYHVKMCLPRPD